MNKPVGFTGNLESKIVDLERRIAILENPRQASVLSVGSGTLTLLNGWLQNGGDVRPVLVAKYPDGRIEFEGSLDSNGATTTSDIAFVIPAGYRPTYNKKVPTFSTADRTVQDNWVEVTASGTVQASRVSTPTGIDLEPIQYTVGLPKL